MTRELFLIIMIPIWVLLFLLIILPREVLSNLWHWIKMRSLMRADASAILDDDIPCGEENPGRPYNYCEIVGDHTGKPHRDGDDKEWFGRDV